MSGIAGMDSPDLNANVVWRYSAPERGAYQRVEEHHRGQSIAPLQLPACVVPVDVFLIGQVVRMLGEKRHGFTLLVAGGLVHNHLKPGHLAHKFSSSRCRRVADGRVSSTACQARLKPMNPALYAAVHDRGLDVRARRCGIDGPDLQLSPGAAVGEHHATHDGAGTVGYSGSRSPPARTHAHRQ